MVAGCSNTNAIGVSIFNLPKNEEFITGGLSRCSEQEPIGQLLAKSSVLFGDHFEESCFEPHQKVGTQFGIAMRS